MTASIVVLDDFGGIAASCADWASLRRPVEFVTRHLNEEELVARLADAEIVVAMRERSNFPGRLLRKLTPLRLLVNTGMGVSNIDVEAANERGIVVCGTDGLLPPAAELAWGMILALARDLPGADRSVRAGAWRPVPGLDLAGATLGLVGLGNLGTRMARYARAFDMRAIAWSPHLTRERAEAAGCEAVTKDDLFAHADVVSVHLRLSESTSRIIGTREFARMRPGAIFVNTARSGLVDQHALIAALEAGRIRAGIDVFDEEPLVPDADIRSAPGTLLTPHVGYVTGQGMRTFYGGAVEAIQAFSAGRPARVLNFAAS